MDFKTCFELGVDYMNLATGMTYAIQQYKYDKKVGKETKGVAVYQNGELYGYVPEDRLQELIK